MERIQSVDTIRLIAIIAVIAIHTQPFFYQVNQVDLFSKSLGIFINQLARFAVPFFFVISGYFFGRKVTDGLSPYHVARKSASKILTLFVVWTVVYIGPYNLGSIYEFGLSGPIEFASWRLSLLGDSERLIFEGGRIHLWFLSSLVMCFMISAFFINYKMYKSLYLLAFFLYVFGVLAKSYSVTNIGIDISFNTRNGPFLGLFLFASGVFLSRLSPAKDWFGKGLIIFLVGAFVHFSEIIMLGFVFDGSVYQDYVFGTCLMGIGAGMVSLSGHQLLLNERLSSLGKLTLGIYASHFIFIDNLKVLDRAIDNPIWEVSFVLIVLVLSYAFTAFLAKYKYTKPLVC
jgi:surface polysaccharide O-acyltransferase-like enzyme